MSLIEDLEAAHDLEEGFLGLLRRGHCDSHAWARFLRLLQSIDMESAETIDRRLVSLLWCLPLFMQWQVERLEGEEKVTVREAVDEATNQLESILGVP